MWCVSTKNDCGLDYLRKSTTQTTIVVALVLLLTKKLLCSDFLFFFSPTRAVEMVAPAAETWVVVFSNRRPKKVPVKYNKEWWAIFMFSNFYVNLGDCSRKWNSINSEAQSSTYQLPYTFVEVKLKRLLFDIICKTDNPMWLTFT